MPADSGCTLTAEGRAEPRCLDHVHDLVSELWTRAPDVDLTDRYRFETAVVEVAGNIVEHGGPDVRVRLELSVRPDRLEAQISDTGRAVDVAAALAHEADVLDEDGRGLALARAAVHGVHYQRAGGTNHWRVLLHRSAAVHPFD